jgi:hypothetical protein
MKINENEVAFRKEQFSDIISHSLDFLDEDLKLNKVKSNEFHNIPISYFYQTPIEPIGLENLAQLGEVTSTKDYHGLFTNVRPQDLYNKIDWQTLWDMTDKPEYDYDYLIVKCREIQPSECRGRIAFLRSLIVELSCLMVTASNKNYKSYRFYMTYVDNKWIALTSPSEYGETRKIYKVYNPELHNCVMMTCAAQFSGELSWYLKIQKHKQDFSIKIPLHPEASKYLFKLREVPINKQRRPMLRNWIIEHTRTLKNNIVTDVRDHLRGNVKFDFADYECTIIPSLSDRIKNKEEIQLN